MAYVQRRRGEPVGECFLHESRAIPGASGCAATRKRRPRVDGISGKASPRLHSRRRCQRPVDRGGSCNECSPAIASTKPSPVKHRGQALNLPKGMTGGGSFALGTQRSAAEKVDRSLEGAKGAVDVMIELDAAPASTAYTQARSRGGAAAKLASRNQTATIKSAQAKVEARFGASATKARTLYKAHSLYAGVAVRTDASKLRRSPRSPASRRSTGSRRRRVSNSSSVPLIGAPAVWKAKGETGQGVRVGVIDTGIDYTHADFGGPGTLGAYNAAKASNTSPPPPRWSVATTSPVTRTTRARRHDARARPQPARLRGPRLPRQRHHRGSRCHEGRRHLHRRLQRRHRPGHAGHRPRCRTGRLALRPQGVRLRGSTPASSARPSTGPPTPTVTVTCPTASTWSTCRSAPTTARPDDPDSVASNNLAALGTVVVASMGNSGDVYEVGGAPGDATRVLAVAASDDGNDVVDGLKVDSPAGIEPANTVDGKQDNIFAALKSVAYDWTNDPGSRTPRSSRSVTGASRLPPPTTSTAARPFSTADAAKVAGKIVLTQWFDGTGRRCGSAGRAQFAQDAGAAGVIYGSDVNSFSAGVTGDADIPAMLTVNQATVAIRAKLEATPAVPVFATMTNELRNSVTVINHGAIDKIAGFSSRGVGIANNVKPDVAAPGVTTFSVAVGTGNEGIAESGTSMASPHVAGEAALVRGAHSSWTSEEVKAAIMNTATQDVFVGDEHTGAVYGPERVGSGRVKADAAVDTTTLAYVKDTPGAVSVSFGPVAVTAATTTLTKTVKVVNKRPTGTSNYTVSYAAAHPTPGVTYSFSPSQVSLPAGGSADVKVTATITRSALRPVADPTTASDPLDLGIDQNYRADASGRMVLTPVGTTPGSKLRVPVWSAPGLPR